MQGWKPAAIRQHRRMGLASPCACTISGQPSAYRIPSPLSFQVDVDITSNTVANSVTSLVVGAITSLVVDLAPLVEGQVRVLEADSAGVGRRLVGRRVGQWAALGGGDANPLPHCHRRRMSFLSGWLAACVWNTN